MRAIPNFFTARGGAPHRQLLRDPRRRVLGGVASGLGEHLGIDVLIVRAAFAVLAAVQGAGLLLYALFWVVVPQAAYDGDAPAPRRPRGMAEALAVAALGVAGFALATVAGVWDGRVALPVIVAATGVALIWRQADEGQRARWSSVPRRLAVGVRAEPSSGIGALRLAGGAVLLAIGAFGFLVSHDALAQARQGLLFAVVVVTGLGMVTAPWWTRLAGELAAERRERIRSQERAELAARVHDSVLHTLALIQRHAQDPAQVQLLARVSERELRSWLYKAPADAAANFGAAVEAAAAEVEDAHAVPVEVVGVGDCALDDRLRALVAATREAMVNAAKSSGAPVASVFYEVEPDAVTVFVRDRGVGFALDEVPGDRYGVRESILGRMARHGGTAVLRTARGEGTEVELRSPR